MIEPRLGKALTKRLNRVTWTTLAGYTLLVLVVWTIVAAVAVRRSFDHSADVIASLIDLYADPEGTPTGVAPNMLADRLVGMEEPFVITRTTDEGTDHPTVYYLSPTMPAQRLEALGDAAGSSEARQLLLDALVARATWRYSVFHRHIEHGMGDFDIYVLIARTPYLWGLAGLALAGIVLLPVAAWAARRGVGRAVTNTLAPLERVATETRSIHPDDLSRRMTSPTGQHEVTELADGLNRMLDRVERFQHALQSFTADASHELRTPLTHMRAQVHWCLAQDRSPDEVHEAFDAIDREIDRTTKMIDDLLVIARSENQQLPLAEEAFDLNDVVVEIEEIGQAMATGREVQITTSLDGPLVVTADPNRVRQILLNLISNAIRYTPKGTVDVSTRTEVSRVGVSVRDTGVGIPKEMLDRIFDRFYRGESSRSRDHGGSGLGLTIAKALAELQGGQIEVESTVGEGSAFTLWLPKGPVPKTESPARS